MSFVYFLAVAGLSALLFPYDSCHAEGVPQVRRRRMTEATVATTCDEIRFEPYRARLDIFYYYLVEYAPGTTIKLSGLTTAIANAIASALDQCDESGRPLFAVKLDADGHVYSAAEGQCERAAQVTSCHVIRGSSSIYLDKGARKAEEGAYTAIQLVLGDTAFLREFTGVNLQYSDFIRSISANIVVLSSEAGGEDDLDTDNLNGATKIAVAAALVSFALATLFLYGLYRSHIKEFEMERPSVSNRVAHLKAKRRKFFKSLPEDGGIEPGWMTTEPESMKALPAPSITWSLSDLTSDSHSSIKSSLRMDPIEEEDAPDAYSSCEEDEADGTRYDPGSSFEEEKEEIAPLDLLTHRSDPRGAPCRVYCDNMANTTHSMQSDEMDVEGWEDGESRNINEVFIVGKQPIVTTNAVGFGNVVVTTESFMNDATDEASEAGEETGNSEEIHVEGYPPSVAFSGAPVPSTEAMILASASIPRRETATEKELGKVCVEESLPTVESDGALFRSFDGSTLSSIAIPCDSGEEGYEADKETEETKEKKPYIASKKQNHQQRVASNSDVRSSNVETTASMKDALQSDRLQESLKLEIPTSSSSEDKSVGEGLPTPVRSNCVTYTSSTAALQGFQFLVEDDSLECSSNGEDLLISPHKNDEDEMEDWSGFWTAKRDFEVNHQPTEPQPSSSSLPDYTLWIWFLKLAIALDRGREPRLTYSGTTGSSIAE